MCKIWPEWYLNTSNIINRMWMDTSVDVMSKACMYCVSMCCREPGQSSLLLPCPYANKLQSNFAYLNIVICFPVALILTHNDQSEEPIYPLETKLQTPAAAAPQGEYRKRSPGPRTAGTRSTEKRMWGESFHLQTKRGKKCMFLLEI